MDAQTIIPLAIIGVSLLFVVVALFIRRTVAATIERFSWKRNVLLEHYVWVQKTSYRGYPNGSRNHQSATESYQSYEVIGHATRTTVVDGTTTMTTDPVYGFVSRTRTKYTYEIQKWVNSSEHVAKGDERATLAWPAYTLDSDTQERVKRTQGKYLVFFKSIKGKIYKLELPEADWTALDDKSAYTLKLDVFGQIKRFLPNREQVAGMPAQTS
jgi:hypothetical protein